LKNWPFSSPDGCAPELIEDVWSNKTAEEQQKIIFRILQVLGMMEKMIPLAYPVGLCGPASSRPFLMPCSGPSLLH